MQDHSCFVKYQIHPDHADAILQSLVELHFHQQRAVHSGAPIFRTYLPNILPYGTLLYHSKMLPRKRAEVVPVSGYEMMVKFQ